LYSAAVWVEAYVTLLVDTSVWVINVAIP
jgi:hypothetical protein